MYRPLKVAIVTQYFPSSALPYRGRALEDMARELAKLANVRIFCIDPAYPRFRALQPGSFPHRDSEASHRMPDLEVEYLRYPAIRFISRPLNGYACGRALLPRLRDFSPTVVLAFFLYPEGFGAVTAGHKLGVPVVVGALGSDLCCIEGRFLKKAAQRTLGKAAFAIAVSEDLRRRAIACGIPPEKCKTIRNGCDHSIFHPSDREGARTELGLNPNDAIVVFTGHLIPLKGIRELVVAASILLRTRPNLRVVCIGEGPLGGELLRRASDPHLKGRISFLGAMDAAKIARWIAAADVFCLPSYSEGCPNAVIEALACGRPVVASNVGGVPELVSHQTGILVRAGDVEHLARGLAEALDRNWSPEALSLTAQRTWGQVASEINAVCRAVAQSGLTV